MVLERLHKGVANSRFFDIYPMVIEKHIVKDSSYHIHILFNLHGIQGHKKDRIFPFEHMWLSHDGCKNVMKYGWVDFPCVTM